VWDGFGSSGREQLVLQAKEFGFQIISDETYGPKDTDMTAQLTKIRGSYLLGHQPRAGHCRQKRQTTGNKTSFVYEPRCFLQKIY